MRALAAIALLGAAVPGPASADAAAQFREFLDDMQSLSARFQQTVRDVDGRVLSSVAGTMRLLRPRRLHWVYGEPEPMVLAADGGRFWVYDPVLAQATVRPIEQALPGTPLRLLLGEERAGDVLTFRTLSSANGLDWLAVRPRGATEREGWTIGLRAGVLEDLRFHDALGRQVRLKFEQLRINPPLRAEDFAYAPPPGTDILEPGQP